MNNFRPTASDRKEKRVVQNFSLHSVEISDDVNSSWKERVGVDIFFWSWTIGKINENARTKVFVFHTLGNFGFHKIQKQLKKYHQDWEIERWTPFKFGTGLGLQIPYGVSHAIEVRVPEPTPWLELMEKTTICLEPVIKPKPVAE
jgi:hypothetical protein